MSVNDALGRIEEKLDSLSKEVHENRVLSVGIHSTQAAQILNLEGKTDGLYRKIREHTADHWKFVLGSTGTVGIIVAAAKWIGS